MRIAWPLAIEGKLGSLACTLSAACSGQFWAGRDRGGSSLCCLRLFSAIPSRRKRQHSRELLPRIVGSSAAAHIGIEYGVKGPTFATCSTGASAAHAIGIGRGYIRNGLVDVAIVRASDSMITYGVMLACQAMHLLSPQGCFPFSREAQRDCAGRGGLGVGAGNSERHAAKRGAKMLAQLCGFGMSSNGNDMVTPDVEGTAEAMRLALDDASFEPTAIDYLNARHGDDRER